MRKKEKMKTAPTVIGYDYSTREAREETVAQLFHRAKNARTAVEQDWTRYNDYYNFVHDVTGQTQEYCQDNDISWSPAVLPDPWILVESQIDPSVPEPEFRGRDSDEDSEKARQREYAVRYICDNNRLSDMNTRNERRLIKLGDAFWKAYWDPGMQCGINRGDIRIRDIPVESVYPDPAIRDGELQDGEYLDYVYRIHKVQFARQFRTELEERGLRGEEILSSEYTARGGIFDMVTSAETDDDTVQVLEHWFRQPEALIAEDGTEIPAGAVACSIQAGGKELRYIPNYWERTGTQCRLFPFVHYWRIQDENRFWNKSELFPVLDLVDAADRKLSMAILNDAFLANDILLVEEGALADGAELTNEPGAVVRVRQNRMNGVSRLGGLNSVSRAAVDVNWFKEQIERASRNYEIGMGKEAVHTLTASGLSMLRSDASDQADIKKADRNAGFERLYELLDWLALEFFDDDRMLYIGADEKRGREAWSGRYNSASFAEVLPEVRDMQGMTVCSSRVYWPRVDVTVSVGDGVIHGKTATLQALQSLAQAVITADNWRIFAQQLDVLDIPGKKEIVDAWRTRFEAEEKANESQTEENAGKEEDTNGLSNL